MKNQIFSVMRWTLSREGSIPGENRLILLQVTSPLWLASILGLHAPRFCTGRVKACVFGRLCDLPNTPSPTLRGANMVSAPIRKPLVGVQKVCAEKRATEVAAWLLQFGSEVPPGVATSLEYYLGQLLRRAYGLSGEEARCELRPRLLKSRPVTLDFEPDADCPRL
jgi:hypothetical protein